MSGHMTTKAFMASVRRQITRFEKSVSGECGHEDAIAKSVNLRLELERFIENEHESLFEQGEFRAPAERGVDV